ncbi:g1382 [Coccomyxa elongata]
MQALPNTQRSSGAQLRHPAPKHGSGVPLYTAPRRRSVGRHSQTPFPGEDAPGTGRRHFPEEVPESKVSVAERPESFEMRSTQDMYKEFPGLIRSSYPLYVRNAGPQEPLGEVERRAEDAGPATRNRRRPEPVDPSPPTERLPLHAEDPEALKREVASRKGC